jgi:hypothetical protein
MNTDQMHPSFRGMENELGQVIHMTELLFINTAAAAPLARLLVRRRIE